MPESDAELDLQTLALLSGIDAPAAHSITASAVSFGCSAAAFAGFPSIRRNALHEISAAL